MRQTVLLICTYGIYFFTRLQNVTGIDAIRSLPPVPVVTTRHHQLLTFLWIIHEVAKI